MMALGLVVGGKKNGTKGVLGLLGAMGLAFWFVGPGPCISRPFPLFFFSLFYLSCGYGHLGVGDDRRRWTCDRTLDLYATVHQLFDIHASARDPLSSLLDGYE